MSLFGTKKDRIEAHTNMLDVAQTIMATAEAQKAGMLKDQRGVKEGWITETEMAMIVAIGHMIGGDDELKVKKVVDQLSIAITQTKFKMGEIKKEDIVKALLGKFGFEVKVKA